MGKRPKKKIVLILVEGQSDMNALQIVLPKLYQQVDEEIRVYFPTIQDVNQTGGDITSKYGIKPDNIEGCINKLFLYPFFQTTGLYPKDITEVVQIVDLDGAYVPADAIYEYDDPESETRNVTYFDNCIRTKNVNKIIERNLRKMGNLSHLASMDTIKVKTKVIKYSAYYFSSNLDHYIHHDANLSAQEKCNKADDYSVMCSADMKFFLNSFMEDCDAALGMTYDESWNFIKEGKHSLERHTNMNLLFQKILNNNIGS